MTRRPVAADAVQAMDYGAPSRYRPDVGVYYGPVCDPAGL